MNFIRVMHDRIYINCRRRVLIYLTAALCAAVFAASPSAALTRSEDGFYLIATAAELAEFRDMVNSGNNSICAKLTADIDLSVNDEPSEWKPIGNPNFNGTFDGGGHTVSGYVVRDTVYDEELKTDYAGFFANVGESNTKAKVINLVLYGDIAVSAGSYLRAGGITGQLYGQDNAAEKSQILNCVYIGDIQADSEINSVYAGGIVGYNNNGAISNSFYSGNVLATTVSGTSLSGGIVGFSSKDVSESVINCCWQAGGQTGEGYAAHGVGNYGEWNILMLTEDIKYMPIVTAFAANIISNENITIDVNDSAKVALITKPDTPRNPSDYIVSPGIVENSYDSNVIEVINNNDLTFTVKPLSVGDTSVTFSAILYPTDFSNVTDTKSDTLKQEMESTVNIKVTGTPTTPPASGNGGGCSAGFGNALLAAIAFFAFVKKPR